MSESARGPTDDTVANAGVLCSSVHKQPTRNPGPVLSEARTLFTRAFGCGPAFAAYSPGRVNLIGDHVDYCGGFVLPMAIERGTVVVGSPGENGMISVVSTADADVVSRARVTPHVGGDDPRRQTVSYVAAVVREHLARIGGDRLHAGLNVAIAGDLPIGAGLSSSASLEVAIALLAQQVAHLSIPAEETARICQQAEFLASEVPCGIMDQYACALGEGDHALLIDCFERTHRPIPLGPEARCIIVHSGISRSLSDGRYATRRTECEWAHSALCSALGPRSCLRHFVIEDVRSVGASLSAVQARRARHVISESARTRGTAAALESGDMQAVGQLMQASHASLRDDFQVSTPEIDRLVDRLMKLPRVWGARMTGAGFGGCVVALVAADAADSIVADLRAENRMCFATRPAVGARPILLDL